MQLKKLFVIGSVTSDLYFQGAGLPVQDEHFSFHLGEKYHSDKFAMRVGGGGANVAITAKLFEIDTQLISVCGQNSFGKLQMADLERYGINTKYIIPCPDYNNVSCILLGSGGERSVINYRTPHCQQRSLIEMIQKIASREKAAWFYFGGNLPDIPLSEKALLFHFLVRLGHKVALNLSSVECKVGLEALGAILANTALLVQNRQECSYILGSENLPLDRQNLKKQFATLSGDLVVTADKLGAYWYESEKSHHQKAVMVDNIVDTTGAGDAFSGALMAAVIKNYSPVECLEKACEYAGKKLKNFGAH